MQDEYSDDINRFQKDKRKSSREIGPPPDIVDAERRREAGASFLQYLSTYHRETFPLQFAEVHRQMAAAIEDAILGQSGHRTLFVVPRGSGKTSFCIRGLLWACLYGHKKFCVLVSQTDDEASRNLKTIRMELETNQLLYEDFPEVTHPFRCLDRMTQRAVGQICDDAPTFLTLTSDEIIFPTTTWTRQRDNAAVCYRVAGITSAIRGFNIRVADGRTIRPDVIFIDDPQNRESASSPKQVGDRESIIASDIGGLVGPGVNLSVFCAGTPIIRDDLICRLADKNRNPEWRTVRCQAIQSWPTNDAKWNDYAEILRGCWMEDRQIDEAHRFYLEKREALEEGAEHYWPARIAPGFHSALESAMASWIANPVAFAAEYQCDPLDQQLNDDVVVLSAQEIRACLSSYHRGEVPLDAVCLTAFVDIQKTVLPWVVCAFEPNFVGVVIDYGTWPKQDTSYWTLRSLTKKISGRGGFDHVMTGALRSCMEMLAGKEYFKPNGMPMRLSTGLIDCSWGLSTALVFRACDWWRRSGGSGEWAPSQGVGITASTRPLNEGFRIQRNERKGPHWQFRYHVDHSQFFYRYDANFWKTQVHKSLGTAVGEPGSLSLFEGRHELFADHVSAEYPVITEGRGRRVVEWKLKPGSENHWFDGLVGCCVGASAKNVILPGHETFHESLRRRPIRVLTAADVAAGKR